MRAFFTTFLVAVLLACPSLCRATEVVVCAGHGAESCPDESGHEAPAAPTDVDSCICICSAAAVKADTSQAAFDASPFDSSLGSFVEHLLPRSNSFAVGDRPADPDDWREPLRLHSLLQVYRC